MAALTFPLTKALFADLLTIESVDWNLRRVENLTAYGSGDFLSSELAPPRWVGSVKTVDLTHAEARAIQAKINAMGSTDTALVYDPRSQYPIDDPLGTAYGASTPIIASINADNKRITISGLPAAYRISLGDMLEINYDSGGRYFLAQAMEQETADGAGLTSLFEVRPHLIETIATSDPVTLIKPAAKVKIVPGSDRFTSVSALFSTISFDVVQTYED